MKNQQLGFSVSCYRGDLPFARATLSSIRKFAPDAPICLIVDGEFSTQSLEKTYGAHVIRRKDVKNPDLRKHSFGYGLTKMVALWEAPFDIIFHVDADAILWGDIRKNLPKENWDVVYNEPHEIITEEIQKTQYFDPERIFNYIQPFEWQGNEYFNGGAFCIQKGVLDLDEYMHLLEIQRTHDGVIACAEQGILALMIFRAVRAGKMIAKSAHLQTLIPMIEKETLKKNFCFNGDEPLIGKRPTIIHWAGKKPWKENKEIFKTPMNYFRARGLRECGLPDFFPKSIATQADEFAARYWPEFTISMKKQIKSLIGIKPGMP